MAVDTKGLQRLINRADALYKADVRKMVGDAMYDRGAFEIHKYYSDAFISQQYSSGITRIDVTAPGLWFREYGTGIVGKGTYSGQLPTTPLDFESRGASQYTNGWEYEYHPATQAIHGWYWGNNFSRGMVAKAGMYFSARYLQTNAAEIVKECLRSVGK